MDTTEVQQDSPPAWKTAVCSVALSAGLFAACLSIFEPAWDSDDTDDPRMALKVAGIGSPLESEPHLLYTHLWVGRGLAALHKASPNLPWYGIYILLAQAIAWAALLDCVFHLCPQKTHRVLLSILAGSCIAWSVTHLQFTTTATITATAGALQILTALQLERRDSRSRWSRVLAGWSLVLLSSAIRIQSCYLIGAIFLPAGLMIAWQLRKQVRLTPHVAVAVGGVAAVFGLLFVDRHAHESDPGWKAFREFEHPFAILLNNQKLRREYLGRDPLAGEIRVEGSGRTRHAAALAKAGWNADDLKLFLLWYAADSKVHSTDSLRVLHEGLIRSPVSGETRFLVMATATAAKLMSDRVFCLCLLLSVLTVALSGESSARWQAAFLWLFVFGLLLFVRVTMKLPERVTNPAGIAALFATLATSRAVRQPQALSKGQSQLLSIAVLIAAGWVLSGAWNDSRFAAEQRPACVQEFEELARDTDYFHVILQPGGFQFLSPLRTHRQLDSLKYVYLDGTQQSPTFEASCQTAGITNLSRAIAFHSNVRLVGSEPRLTLLKRFLQRHYSVDVDFIPLRQGRFLTVNSIARKTSAQ